MTLNKKQTVLIVDDSRDLVATLLDHFEQYESSFSIRVAFNGKEALQVLKSEAIALIVTDIMMPEMDGITLLSHLINDYPGIPCIVLSAHNNRSIQERLKSMGSVAFFEKPFNLDELTDKIISQLSQIETTGYLQGISLETFLHLLILEKKSGVVEIFHRPTREKGSILLKNGELYDAKAGRLEGEEAFFNLLFIERNEIKIQFHFREIATSSCIGRSMVDLIDEALRYRKEQKTPSFSFFGEPLHTFLDSEEGQSESLPDVFETSPIIAKEQENHSSLYDTPINTLRYREIFHSKNRLTLSTKQERKLHRLLHSLNACEGVIDCAILTLDGTFIVPPRKRSVINLSKLADLISLSSFQLRGIFPLTELWSVSFTDSSGTVLSVVFGRHSYCTIQFTNANRATAILQEFQDDLNTILSLKYSTRAEEAE